MDLCRLSSRERAKLRPLHLSVFGGRVVGAGGERYYLLCQMSSVRIRVKVAVSD